jgi:hypothetical protein
MTGFERALISARLTFKVHRFEVVAMTVAALVVAALALWVKWQIDSSGATQACLEQWLASAGEPTQACIGQFERWATIAGGDGGKVMGAMLVAPFAVGIVLGVRLSAARSSRGRPPLPGPWRDRGCAGSLVGSGRSSCS